VFTIEKASASWSLRPSRAAFAIIHQLERGREIGGFGGDTVLGFDLREELCNTIVPTKFPREFVPDVHLRAI
jgi:hypothetical protein